MTTIDHPPVDAVVDQVLDDMRDESTVGELLDAITATAAQTGDGSTPFAAGTFALYTMPNGGVMVVMHSMEGPLKTPEPQRAAIPAGMIRAMAVLAGGGSKLAALRAMTSKPRKQIGA